QHPAGKLLRHLLQRCWLIVEGWNEGINRCAGLGSAVHVVDVHTIERSLADTEHERTLFLETYIRSAINEISRKAVSNSCQRSHAAGKHDHSIGTVRSAGNACANVVDILLPDLLWFRPEQLLRKIITAFDVQFLGKDP